MKIRFLFVVAFVSFLMIAFLQGLESITQASSQTLPLESSLPVKLSHDTPPSRSNQQIRQTEAMTINIEGPITGVIGIAYTFTATVDSPTVTPPITYTWEADAQDTVTETNGISHTVFFSWTISGNKEITVTANISGTNVVSNTTISIIKGPTATPTNTPTNTSTVTQTETPSMIATPSQLIYLPLIRREPAPTPTPTFTPTLTSTPTLTPTLTMTPTLTPTPTPPVIANGSFEDGLDHWPNTGELPVSIQTQITAPPGESDSTQTQGNILLLGYTSYECQSVPLGEATVTQSSITVPDDAEFLKFDYIIWSQDASISEQFDRFEVYIEDELKFSDGNLKDGSLSCSNWWRVPDSGWELGSISLKQYRGQTITLSFRNHSRFDNNYNTYTYIDNVRVE